jgi:hypothetical protein
LLKISVYILLVLFTSYSSVIIKQYCCKTDITIRVEFGTDSCRILAKLSGFEPDLSHCRWIYWLSSDRFLWNLFQ